MIYIDLFHGRKDPTQDMEEWGGDGPLFGPFKRVHATYKSHIRLVLPTIQEIKLRYAADGIEVRQSDPMWKRVAAELDELHNESGGEIFLWYFEDMLYYDGVFYGDWSSTGFTTTKEARPGETPMYPEPGKLVCKDFTPGTSCPLSDQETMNVLAGLRLFQEQGANGFEEYFEDHAIMSSEAINDLCERLNTAGPAKPVEKEYKVSVVKSVTSSIDYSIKAASAEEAEEQALKNNGLVIPDDPNTQVTAKATEVAV